MRVNDNVHVGVLRTTGVNITFISASIKSRKLKFVSNSGYFVTSVTSSFVRGARELVRGRTLQLQFVRTDERCMRRTFSSRTFMGDEVIYCGGLAGSGNIVRSGTWA